MTVEEEAFLKGCIQRDPDVSLGWLQQALVKKFDCDVSLSAVSRTLTRIDPDRVRKVGRPQNKGKKTNALRGASVIDVGLVKINDGQFPIPVSVRV